MRRPIFPVISSLFLMTLVGCIEEDPMKPEPEDGEDAAQLAPPPASEGFQFETEDMTVGPGVEEQDCYFFKVRDLAKQGGLDPDKPVNLHRVQVAQRDGSHHMNIFRVRTIVGLDPQKGLVQRNQNGQGECFKSPNWADWPLVANSQQEATSTGPTRTAW